LLTVATEVQMIFFRANSRFSISYKMTEFPVVGGGGGCMLKLKNAVFPNSLRYKRNWWRYKRVQILFQMA